MHAETQAQSISVLSYWRMRLAVSSSSWSWITWMSGYSNRVCSGHPLANQVPSILALSNKLETDVLGRAEFVSIVRPVCLVCKSTPSQEAVSPLCPFESKAGCESWLFPTCPLHVREVFFLLINLLIPLFSVTFLPNAYKPLWSFPIIMALPANLSENGFSIYLIPFNYLDIQGSGHTPQAVPCLHPIHLFSWIMDPWLWG